MDAQLTVREVGGEVTVPSLVAEWEVYMMQQVAAGEIATATARTYARGMRRFVDWLASEDIGHVDSTAVLRWKAHLRQEGHKPTGVNTFYAGVRAFYRWAKAMRGLLMDPTAGVRSSKRRNTGRHVRSALSDAEVRRVLAQPDPSTVTGKRDRAMLLLLAYTGVRSVEVQRARVGHLRSGEKLRLWVYGKGHESADDYVYLVNEELFTAMYDWLAVHPRGEDMDAALFCGLGNRNAGGPLSLQSIRRLVKGYYKAAGIRDPRKSTHSLRHSLVTNLLGRGVAIPKVMALTRHKSAQTLINYAHEVGRDSDPAEGYVDYGN